MVRLDKAPQIGFAVVENAKLQILKGYKALSDEFEFYDFCYTDTDSILCECKAPGGVDPMTYLIENRPDMFCNDKSLGKWASEFAGDNKPIEYCGLGPKQYCVLTERDKYKMAHKGISKKAKVVTSGRTFVMEDFKTVLTTRKPVIVDYERWNRKNHLISVKDAQKIALTFEDLKRFILPDGIHTLPYGHSRISELREAGEEEDSDRESI